MITVYTALFGPYDTIQPPLHPNQPGVEFVLFTDQKVNPKGWRVEKCRKGKLKPSYESRRYFDQSCLHLPRSDYTIMHGGNSVVSGLVNDIVKELPDGYDIAAFRHPQRRTVYEEAKACIRLHKDRRNVIDKQMERYRSEGLPESVRLSACILLIRRNTPALKEFETAWWEEVKNGSCRDQLSFDYVRWKLDFPVWFMEGNPYHRSDIFRVRKHDGR